MKILVLYQSGVGNTKQVAQWIEKYLQQTCDVDLYSCENTEPAFVCNHYNAIVFGFPTIHTSPSKQMLGFIQNVQNTEKQMPVFVYTTCGLYSANTVRIFCKIIEKKNFIPVLTASYRMKALDGMLLASGIKFFTKNERNLQQKILNDCERFCAMIQTGKIKKDIPRFKLYSILNYPNKLAGQFTTFPIFLDKDDCVKCGKCRMNCPKHAITSDMDGYPVIRKDRCENCYRCIHHCPERALSLKKNHRPKEIWKPD